MWRILFPFCFFILLSTCVFWMQRESLDRRVSIVAAFALTAVAFNFVVSSYFPNVSYLTILDTIILSGYLMCGITIVSVISFELFKHRRKAENMELRERRGKVCLPAGLCIGMVCDIPCVYE